jgi:hypothetical protein
MKEHLLPAGFVQSHASVYVRRRDELIELINFQTSTWGVKFTVNLCFQYSFTPSSELDINKAWRRGLWQPKLVQSSTL